MILLSLFHILRDLSVDKAFSTGSQFVSVDGQSDGMSFSEQAKTIVVLGATGGQGRGVISALLQDAPGQRWSVRAIVRDVNSERAQKLLAEHSDADDRLSLVAADIYNVKTLQKAFTGAYGVFASTFEGSTGKLLEREEDTIHEVEAGRSIVDAAKECGVKHFVLSSLPDMVKVTAGKYTRIHHMNNKYIIEQYARKEIDNVTSLIPGFFYSNHLWTHYAHRRGTRTQEGSTMMTRNLRIYIADGTAHFRAAIPNAQATQWTDSSYDMGLFATRVFTLGPEKTKGKSYPVMSKMITMDDMASTFTRVTGQAAIHDPLSHEEWATMASKWLGPAYHEDLKQMMQWASGTPQSKICFGALNPEDNRSAEELGVTASTFEDWLKRTGWTSPATELSSSGPVPAT